MQCNYPPSRGVILVITLVLTASISLLSIGVISMALLQSHIGQSLVDTGISKQATVSLLSRLIEEAKAESSSSNWFVKAQQGNLAVCLTDQGLIGQNCDLIYDNYNAIVVVGDLVFISTDADGLKFSLGISVMRSGTWNLLRHSDYQLFVSGLPDDVSVVVKQNIS